MHTNYNYKRKVNYSKNIDKMICISVESIQVIEDDTMKSAVAESTNFLLR